MYYVLVAGLMVVLPVVSIVIEWLSVPGADLIPLIGKWFVFWAVGVRLFAAGEVAGFGGGGYHGYNALEGTFLGGCIFSGRNAGRRAAGSQ